MIGQGAFSHKHLTAGFAHKSPSDIATMLKSDMSFEVGQLTKCCKLRNNDDFNYNNKNLNNTPIKL